MKGITFNRVSSAASSIEECEADDIPVVQPRVDQSASGRPRTALVTGASGGIGCELARVIAAHGHNLVLVARDEMRLQSVAAELEETHGVRVQIIARDLTQPSATSDLYRELRHLSLPVDILVNNAGFAAGGPFAEADPLNATQLLQLNVMALTQLTRLFLPEMIQRGWGRLLQVSSIAAFFPGPLTACYNASKAYVLSFSLALSNELQGTGVSSTALCPGPTRTGFAQRARLLGTRAFSGPIMDPTEVARIGYNALMQGKPKVIAGLRNRMRMFPVPLVPRRILAHFSRMYHEV